MQPVVFYNKEHIIPWIHIRRGEQIIGERVCLPGGRGEAVCRFHKLRVRGSVPSFGRRRACDPYERHDKVGKIMAYLFLDFIKAAGR